MIGIWPNILLDFVLQEERCILVTIADARGSTPRETGTKLLVNNVRQSGSIGGGTLEFQAIIKARKILSDNKDHAPCIERISLGPNLGQCCGGDVTLTYELITKDDITWLKQCAQAIQSPVSHVLLTEFKENGSVKKILAVSGETVEENLALSRSVGRITSGKQRAVYIKKSNSSNDPILIETLTDSRSELWLFGAGHIGLALVTILKELPFLVHWVDTRPDIFLTDTKITDYVSCEMMSSPIDSIKTARANAYFLVMTHSHPLDLAICEAILRRGDFEFLGLIGSATKKARFLKRLREGGISEELIGRLKSPIGIEGINGKSPMEIAVSVSAELLQLTTKS